ncbi:MAG: hypothetical protein ABIF71_05540 [Planctomycetota bacterium]
MTETLLAEERYLIDRYGDDLVGLIAYGSMVFGRPRAGSLRDYWVIYRDYQAFHGRNLAFYQACLNRPSTVAEQIALNREGPNFYSLDDPGASIRIKIAAIQEDDFVRLCAGAATMVVKGRMQKPLRIIRATPRIREGMAAARAEGARDGVDMLRDPRFTMDAFLLAVMGLSYQAEIRIEDVARKLHSIIDKGRPQIEEIYGPLLAGLPHVRVEGDGRFTDTRPPAMRRRARGAVIRRFRRMKWNPAHLRYIWRNYCSYKRPVRYLWDKFRGEVAKVFRSWFVYPVFRRRTAARMVRDYRAEVGGFFQVPGERLTVAAVHSRGRGCYEVLVSHGNGSFTVRCVPLASAATAGAEIARDNTLRFVLRAGPG